MRDQESHTSQTEVIRSEPVPVPDRGAGAGHHDDRPTPAAAANRGGFHEPGPVPTAFGATSVGGAVAASALASPRPEDEPDPREERTARPGDGAADQIRPVGHKAARSPNTRSAGEVATAGVNGHKPAGPAGSEALVDPATAAGLRERWRQIQLRFVDDPESAAGDAQRLVEEAIEALATTLSKRKDSIGGWRDADSVDTERLRRAVRDYRDFLDLVLER